MCHHQAAESLVSLQSDNPNNGLVGKRVQGKAIVLFLGMFIREFRDQYMTYFDSKRLTKRASSLA